MTLLPFQRMQTAVHHVKISSDTQEMQVWKQHKNVIFISILYSETNNRDPVLNYYNRVTDFLLWLCNVRVHFDLTRNVNDVLKH